MGTWIVSQLGTHLAGWVLAAVIVGGVLALFGAALGGGRR